MSQDMVSKDIEPKLKILSDFECTLFKVEDEMGTTTVLNDLYIMGYFMSYQSKKMHPIHKIYSNLCVSTCLMFCSFSEFKPLAQGQTCVIRQESLFEVKSPFALRHFLFSTWFHCMRAVLYLCLCLSCIYSHVFMVISAH